MVLIKESIYRIFEIILNNALFGKTANSPKTWKFYSYLTNIVSQIRTYPGAKKTATTKAVNMGFWNIK